VIAGHAGAVTRAVDAARAAGAKRAMTLPVSVPSHCALMHPAAERLAARLSETDVRPPRIPVLHNVNVGVETTADGIRRALASQVEAPVRWVESVTRIAAGGVRIAIECGPGKVLAGLNKRIVKDMNTIAVFDPASLSQALAAVGGIS
jgi:[acyl-carrier-protein] S-malonyltransferase